MSTNACTICPYIFYRDVPAALAWLGRAFGFVEELRVTTPSGGMHAQASLHGQRIMMGQGAASWRMVSPLDAPPATSPQDAPWATMGVFVYLDGVDAHYVRARDAGAEIVHPPKDESYGRTYAARDLDGHPWFFTTPPA